ncbi:hypothetical protein MLD38_021013 [Melastoma candidum]|uniref:Uncharacterized protein n=1 Tax=Melastoma candidum TaxID=119954 RepID=A0ACB9QIL6_9MYRT|nr:hypothetical protein MLD38_021013 [Melastoma candidum]
MTFSGQLNAEELLRLQHPMELVVLPFGLDNLASHICTREKAPLFALSKDSVGEVSPRDVDVTGFRESDSYKRSATCACFSMVETIPLACCAAHLSTIRA